VEKSDFKYFNSTERIEYLVENVIGLRSDMVVTITVHPTHSGQQPVMAVWESTNECGVEYYTLERWQDTFTKVILACSKQ
jgi:hypothetical protein